MRETFWVLRKIIRYCFVYLFGYMVIALASTGISVGVNLLNRSMLNRLAVDMEGGVLSGIVIGLLIAYMVGRICYGCMNFLGAFGNNLSRLKVDVFMQKLFMYRSIRTKQDSFFHSDFMDRYAFISGRTYMGSNFIFRLVSVFFRDVATIISAVILYAMYAPFLLVYSFMTAVVYGVSTYSVSKKQYDLSRRQINTERQLGYFRGVFTGKNTAKEMRMYGTGGYFFRKWKVTNDCYQKERLEMENKGTNYGNTARMVDYLLYAGMIFSLLYSVKMGGCDVGTFVMLMGLSTECNAAINDIVANVMKGIAEDVRYFKEYYEFVAPMNNKEIRKCLKEIKEVQHDLEGGEKLEPFGNLEIRNVSYTYPGSDRKAVDNVSLKLERGKIVSLLGYNGSGKTTLMKMIYRGLYPEEGQILLNGKDYDAMEPEEVYRYFGVAPQEFSCYALSLRQNVGLGRIEQMEADACLQKAYEDAGLYPLFRKLPEGEQTIIGKDYDQDGILLSGGEQQKMVLAAAYMGEPEVLVLDEPTASIDPFKELEMIQNFREILRGRTAILVSHRIGFARLADRIVMMRDGKIVEQGTHEELLHKKGYYAEMFYAQKELYEEENVQKNLLSGT